MTCDSCGYLTESRESIRTIGHSRRPPPSTAGDYWLLAAGLAVEDLSGYRRRAPRVVGQSAVPCAVTHLGILEPDLLVAESTTVNRRPHCRETNVLSLSKPAAGFEHAPAVVRLDLCRSSFVFQPSGRSCSVAFIHRHAARTLLPPFSSG